MKREKVISILKYYRDIDKAVRLNERVIKNLEDQYYSTLGAANMDGMPHGTTVSSTVENVVLNVPASVKVTIDSLNRENAKLAKMKAVILSEINRLTYHQRAVVLAFYIEGRQWEQISEQVNYSPRQCRNIRDEALLILGKNFGQNKTVARYNFPRN